MPGQLSIDAPTAETLIGRVFPTVHQLDGDAAELIARFGVLVGP